MRQRLINIFEKLDAWIAEENQTRLEENINAFPHPKVLIQVLGQCSLILHPEVTLSLVGTLDLDARLSSPSAGEGVFTIHQRLKVLLDEDDIELEEDAHLIWIPKGSTFTNVFKTERMECEVLDPIYALCSKAVKAPKKNKSLIVEALDVYGDELRELIKKHGGKIENFT